MPDQNLRSAFTNLRMLQLVLLILFPLLSQLMTANENRETQRASSQQLKNYLEQYYQSQIMALPEIPSLKKFLQKKTRSSRMQDAAILAKTPKMAIIIDDIGNNKEMDSKAALLPGKITLAILPHTPHSQTIAAQAFEKNKEVMLHAPMESIEDKNLGKGGLTEDMSKEEFVSMLKSDLVSVPHVVGLNNHMGSLLTQNENAMSWLMTTLAEHKLFFVDSRTISSSVASDLAESHHIDHVSRDVFLDHEATTAYTEQAFNQAIRISKKTGFAVAIGHPYPSTIAFLEKNIHRLEKEGIELVSVSELINFRKSARTTTLLEK